MWYARFMEKKRKSKKKSRPDKVYEYRLSTPLPKIHTLGLASFIITIVGIFTSSLLPFLLQIIGLVMSHVALNDINRNEKEYSGRGLVIASLIINYIILLQTEHFDIDCKQNDTIRQATNRNEKGLQE